MDLSTIFPVLSFTQGDTFNVTVNLNASGYNANQYILAYTFKKVGKVPFSIISTANPDGSFLLYASSSITEAYLPGKYIVVATITNISDSERYTLCKTEMDITPDLSTSVDVFDPRSHIQKILEEIDHALFTCTSDAVTEYTIGGRTVRMNKTELLKMRQLYAIKLRKENGKKSGNIISYGFKPTQTWWF